MVNDNENNEKFEELCAGYVLHTLGEKEQLEFEEMLSEATDEERTLYQQMNSTANQLAFTIESSDPSVELKSRLMNKIQSPKEDSLEPAPSATSMDKPADEGSEEVDDAFNWPVFAAASAFALLIVCLSLIFYSFSLSSQISEQEDIIEKQEAQISEIENELEQKEEMLSVLGAREVNVVRLSGLEVNPEGYGKVFWNSENQQALLQVTNLPAISQDQEYQLWLLRNVKTINTGSFRVDNAGTHFFKIEGLADIKNQSSNTFMITLEPQGEQSQPTGDTYLISSES